LYSNGATYVNLTLLSNDIRQVVTPGDDELDISDDEENDVLGLLILYNVSVVVCNSNFISYKVLFVRIIR